MKSPFPGMDPYLENHWLDVHTSLVDKCRDALNGQLPDDLIASADERIAIEDEQTERGKIYKGDVRVSDIQGTPAVGVAMLSAPIRLVVEMEPATERFLHVIEAKSEKLITVIEFLSPTNKRGDGLRSFREKREDLLASGVSFVEIDLVREGDWRALLRPHVCPRRSYSAYRVTVRMPRDPAAVYLTPIGLRERLPKVAIPLRSHDPELRLDLQALIDLTYTTGRYGRRLDYSNPLANALDTADAKWATRLTHSARRS